MAITVPIAGQEISASTFGIPVANTVNGMTPGPWIDVTTFANGWHNYDTPRKAQYRKIGDMVYLRGLIAGGTIAAAAFTLPAGFLPVTIQGFIVNANEGAGSVNVNPGVSAVIPQTGSNTYVWLTQCFWPIN